MDAFEIRSMAMAAMGPLFFVFSETDHYPRLSPRPSRRRRATATPDSAAPLRPSAADEAE